MSTLQLISFRAQQVVLDDAGTDPHSRPPIPPPPALLPAVCSPLSSFTALSYPLVVPLPPLPPSNPPPPPPRAPAAPIHLRHVRLPAVCSPLSSFTALSYPLVVPLDSASESASGSAAGSAGPTHTVLVPSRRSRFHGVHPPFRSRARGGWW